MRTFTSIDMNGKETDFRVGYKVIISDKPDEGHIYFHLTHEGLIVDIYDQNGELIETWAQTAQELADGLLVD